MAGPCFENVFRINSQDGTSNLGTQRKILKRTDKRDVAKNGDQGERTS